MEWSKRQIDRAGEVLRAAQVAGTVAAEEITRSRAIVLDVRAAHVAPLREVARELADSLDRLGIDKRVNQRLKRMFTIENKLLRHPTLKMSRMQDVAGCRVIVSSLSELQEITREVLAHDRSWRIVKVVDYAQAPRSTGYRSTHVVVEVGGRNVEIQLRTERMHRWAMAFEWMVARAGLTDRGDLDPDQTRWFTLMSEALALEDSGTEIPNLLKQSLLRVDDGDDGEGELDD